MVDHLVEYTKEGASTLKSSHRGKSAVEQLLSVIVEFDARKDLIFNIRQNLVNYLQNINPTSKINHFDGEIVAKARKLDEAIAHLRRSVEDKASEILDIVGNNEKRTKAIEELQSTICQLSEKERLSFLLTRVNEFAQKLLLESGEFQKQFLEAEECNAFVLSADIRRSTELMFKARSPYQYAHFMTELCKDLESIVKEHYGVFDKFTGDGILAFFPDFFSGEDAGYYTITTADLCHKVFQEKFYEFRSSFVSMPTNVGLGIGIDYGTVSLVQIADGLTVVGIPVVYACRMGGAPAGKTLLNQPGYEKISRLYGEYCAFCKTQLEIKNEGSILGYDLKLNEVPYFPSPPRWMCGNEKL